MGKKQGEPTDREKYEVWWHAVTLNDEYKNWLLTDSPLYIENPDHYVQNLPTDEAFKKAEYINRYNQFGDVHSATFEQWWEKRIKFKQDNPEVMDYTQFVDTDIKREWAEMLRFESDYCHLCNAPPKDNASLGNMFAERYKQHLSGGFLYLFVDITAPLDELIKQFKKHVIRQRSKTKHSLETYKRGRIPIADRFMLEEIKTYLMIYEQWNVSEKPKWDYVLKKVAPQIFSRLSTTKSRYTEFCRALKCGERLVINAVRGVFPGRYNSPPLSYK